MIASGIHSMSTMPFQACRVSLIALTVSRNRVGKKLQMDSLCRKKITCSSDLASFSRFVASQFPIKLKAFPAGRATFLSTLREID